MRRRIDLRLACGRAWRPRTGSRRASPTASSLAAVHVSCRNVAPFGSSHSSRSLPIAARPAGESLAGPVTSIATLVMVRRRAGRDREANALRAACRRSTVMSTLAEKNPCVAAASRACGDGIAREAVEQVLRHVLVGLPADEVDRASQRGGDRRGRVDLDAIANRVVGCLRGCARGRAVASLPVSGRRKCDDRRERQREKPEAPDARSSRSRRHSRHYRRPRQRSCLSARARRGTTSATDR